MKHLLPLQAQAYRLQHPDALMIDIRMELEYLYVGHPLDAVHVAWYEYPDMQPDAAQFVARVRREAGPDPARPLLLLCRSGARSLPAGAALEAAGHLEVINILHGFEGDADEHAQRGKRNGWRHDGLPWEQM